MKVLAISYGRNLFDHANRERARMVACSKKVEEFHMIVFSLRPHGLGEQEVGGQFWLYPTNSRSHFGMIFDACRLGYKLIKEQKGEWVITAQDPFEAGLVGFLVKLRTRAFLHIQEHGDFFSTPHWRNESLLNHFRYWFGVWVLRRADHVRVVSLRIKRTLLQLGVHEERLGVLSVAVDTDAFTRALPNPEALKFKADLPLIVWGGRFVKQKNLGLLLQAFARVIYEKGITARLLVIGSGPLQKRIEGLIEMMGITKHVHLLPWTNDFAGMLKAADIYALSSNYEGWGRVLLEAKAAGVPIVTTDVGAAREAVLDGVHASVVPVGNEEMFTKKLTELLRDENLRARYRAAATGDSSRQALSLDEYAEAWVESLGVRAGAL